MSHKTTHHPRYERQARIGTGGMGEVWRARDRLTGQTVALKQVQRDASTPELRLALSHEFQTLCTLRHPFIISVLDYGFEGDHPYLTMPFVEDARPLTTEALAVRRRSPSDALIEVLQALSYLHRRGVIHCDLKPANILIAPDGHARLIDFGIAVISGQSGQIAGTLHYLAPEVLTGADHAPHTDLYAVGVLAYELYTGQNPFHTARPSELLTEILYGEVNFEPLPAPMKPVVTRLMAKDPAQRYGSAAETLRALCSALDLPLPVETTAIRESFLQAARFVGRQAELQTLMQALDDAAHKGQGKAIILSGESGVGKSRLADELRARALVDGVRVVRGQAAADGSLPYHIWREMLPALLLGASPNARETAVLSLITRDIAPLTPHPLPRHPRKDARQRLPSVLTNLLRAQPYPILLIIEDVQWANADDLALIQAVLPALTDRPIMLLITHRSDEQPNLPPELDGCTLLPLNRLSPSDVEALCAAMLGEIGQNPAITTQLQHETEGNAFFLVEVVRALAQDAGTLDAIAGARAGIGLTGGIRRVIGRRLAHLTEDARALLTQAAIIGRRLDLAVLQDLASSTRLDDWLTLCADVALLDVTDGAWRFAHDKIRETLLAELPSAGLAALHARAADALERIHPDDPNYLPAVALHHAGAGHWPRALALADQVAAQARITSGYHSGAEFLRQLLAKHPDTDSPERAQLLILLGEMLVELSDFVTCQRAYRAGVEMCQRLGLERESMPGLLGLAYYELRAGSAPAGIELVNRVLSYPDLAPHTQIYALNLHVFAHMDGSPDNGKKLQKALKLAHDHDQTEGLLLTLQNLSHHHLVNDNTQAALAALQDLVQRAEQVGHTMMQATALFNQSETYIVRREYDKARANLPRIEELIEQTGYRLLGGWVQRLYAELADARGEYQASLGHLRSALRIFGELGALAEVAYTRTWLIIDLVRAGLPHEAEPLLSQLRQEAQTISSEEHLALALAAHAVIDAAFGFEADAADRFVVIASAPQRQAVGLLDRTCHNLESTLPNQAITEAAARARYRSITHAFEDLAG
jgi:predicted ATPase/tRNA A-37 threonylcarbamoyl transferase component Bud32